MLTEISRRSRKEQEDKYGGIEKLKTLFHVFLTASDEDEVCFVYSFNQKWMKVGELKKVDYNWHFLHLRQCAFRKELDNN